jgi:hypothetical protein
MYRNVSLVPRVAVVTGGHSFDVPGFQTLVKGLKECEPVIQHLDDFASSPRSVRQGYDAILFYFMPLSGPTDDGGEWFRGKPATSIGDLGSTKQGILVLHHAILAYRDSPLWASVVGIPDRSFTYHPGEKIAVRVSDRGHPITRGLTDWEMTDETYLMASPGSDSHALLSCDNPRSMKTVGWVRQHGKSRVFCLSLGHDAVAWASPGFREVLSRGVLWSLGSGLTTAVID